MSTPKIPTSLALKNDSSSMGIDTGNTYGLHFEITTQEDWIYDERPPKYDPQILISISVGGTDSALCASEQVASQITFKEGPRISVSPCSSQDGTVSWTVTIHGQVIIGTNTALSIDMCNITPNNVAGEAVIKLLPRLKARHGTDIDGKSLPYTVTKSTPPIVISNVAWSLGSQAGSGTLSWEATGDVQQCTLEANGEKIGADHYTGADSQYTAQLIFEMGTSNLSITATDQNSNSATDNQHFSFNPPSPYFPLQVSNGRPLGLVQSDQTSGLYGVFSNGSGAQIWQNTYSGTQDNWQNTGTALQPGYETSPCVYYNSHFYLLGGSSIDFSDFQRGFWVYKDNDWQALPPPDGWTEPRIGQSVALFGQAIWLAGGFGSSGTLYDDVYSCGGLTWTNRPKLPMPLCNASLATVGGKLYLFGGYLKAPDLVRDGPEMRGATSNRLYCLSDDGKSWVNQQKEPPEGWADFWALGTLKGQLMLLASFGGQAFTGRMTSQPKWQGGDSNLSTVVASLGQDTPPYAFTTFEYRDRLFLVIATSDDSESGGSSVFAYYQPSDN